MSLHMEVRQGILSSFSTRNENEVDQLNDALRFLSKWRSHLIQGMILKHQSTLVMEGPLAGLDFIEQSAEGCHIAKLLGCYEQPLLPFIEEAIKANYPKILNIGCAEGYYAVGMARKMPNTQMYAFDLDTNAQKVCAELALKNGVSERITIGSLFKPEDFEAYKGQHVLVLCDIEGAEHDLLNLEIAPALAEMDLIVESHEGLYPGITQTLINRFQKTHAITLIHDNGLRQLANAPTWFNNLAHLDQLLATWEWRSGPTPWLVMMSISNSSFQSQPNLTITTKKNVMNKVTIDDIEYDFDNLSGEAKNQLVSLQFVDQELQKLNAQAAVLQTARLAYANALKECLSVPSTSH